MDHFHRIYASQAAAYQAMIAPEDADGNLIKTLERLVPALRWPPEGYLAVDLGSGTGRLPKLLGARLPGMVALEFSRAMLAEQAVQRQRMGGGWLLLQADMLHIPLRAGCAGLVTAGWAIGHLVGWEGAAWQAAIGAVLREMARIARPGAALVICETLSTGSLAPAPPHAGLAAYYAWLEGEWGFQRETIATDYQFASPEEAAARTEFFFGAELAATIRSNGWARVPEWTGVWWKGV